MSYPYLGDVIRDLFGIDVPLPLPTFGLSVAVAMLVATAVFRRELHRLGRTGALRPTRNPGTASSPQALDNFVSSFSMVVLIAGVVGARVFHILEHLPEFLAHPGSMIFSRSGLSVMGGLMAGALAGGVMVRRSGLPMRPVMDACAPSLMLGYALGRIGCQISGDGDWGRMADMALKPEWLPDALWAQTYANNILGVELPPPGVYPTPLYETAMALPLALLLWRLRRHAHAPGWLFAVYLVLAGAERLLIEQIRVNPVFEFFGVRATQSELISVVFIVLGLLGMGLLSRLAGAQRKPVG